MTILLPTVHMNGTSKEALLTQYKNCWRAVRDAIDVLEANPPHSRDYYPQNTVGTDFLYEAYQPAREQHNAWTQKLYAVKNDLEELIIGIGEGGHKKV